MSASFGMSHPVNTTIRFCWGKTNSKVWPPHPDAIQVYLPLNGTNHQLNPQ